MQKEDKSTGKTDWLAEWIFTFAMKRSVRFRIKVLTFLHDHESTSPEERKRIRRYLAEEAPADKRP